MKSGPKGMCTLELTRLKGKVKAKWRTYHPSGSVPSLESRDSIFKPIAGWFIEQAKAGEFTRAGFEVYPDGSWRWSWMAE